MDFFQTSKIGLCHICKLNCPSQSSDDSKGWGAEDKLLHELTRPVIAKATK